MEGGVVVIHLGPCKGQGIYFPAEGFSKSKRKQAQAEFSLIADFLVQWVAQGKYLYVDGWDIDENFARQTYENVFLYRKPLEPLGPIARMFSTILLSMGMEILLAKPKPRADAFCVSIDSKEKLISLFGHCYYWFFVYGRVFDSPQAVEKLAMAPKWETGEYPKYEDYPLEAMAPAFLTLVLAEGHGLILAAHESRIAQALDVLRTVMHRHKWELIIEEANFKDEVAEATKPKSWWKFWR